MTERNTPPTPKSSTKQAIVARPRRHPRSARWLTAGSIANDRNSEMIRMPSRLVSFSMVLRRPMNTRTENPTAITARQNHVGSCC